MVLIDWRRSWRLALGGLGLLSVTACNDLPLAEDSPDPLPRFAVNGFAQPEFQPNSRPYREQRQPHARGRAGSAVVTARALLGRDGATEVELSTGALDAPDAPGNISKVQLKFLDPAGGERHEAALNYNGLNGGGSWTHLSSGHVRGQRVQAQVNVRGIDPKRTDVVTVTEPIRRRPDLAVLGVDAPYSVVTGTSVTVLAFVGELNGEVGARANCVLYVDGQEADRSNGVWIADGDQVVCAFAHRFGSEGNYQLRVALESVAPGDWDLDNNSNSTEITVADPEPHGYVEVSDYRSDYSMRDYGWNRGASGGIFGVQEYYQTWDRTYNSADRYLTARYYATTPAEWPRPLAITARLLSNGAEFDRRSAAATGNDNPCSYHWSDGFNVEVCSSEWGSNIHAYRWTGSAWYWSHEIMYRQTCAGTNCTEFFNDNVYTESEVSGTWYHELVNDVTWDVEVTTANGTVRSVVSVPLVESNFSSIRPESCRYITPEYWSCYGEARTSRSQSGFTTF